MAATYHLLCLKCHCYLSLGKVYELDEHGKPLGVTTFDGVYESKTRTWRKRDSYFGQVIEAFFVLHRNHELRFAPEGVDELLETPSSAVDPVDPEILLGLQKDVHVDPEAELSAWTTKIKGSLE